MVVGRGAGFVPVIAATLSRALPVSRVGIFSTPFPPADIRFRASASSIGQFTDIASKLTLVMRHTARSFLVEVALPAYEEFVSFYNGRVLGQLKDTSNACVVAEALLHMPDRIYRDSTVQNSSVRGYPNLRAYRESFWSVSPAYEIVCDLANAYKHHDVTRDGKKIKSIENVQENCVFVKYNDSLGDYYVYRKALTIKCIDNKELLVDLLLRESMELWLNELHKLQIIEVVPNLPSLLPFYLSRDQASKLPTMRFQGQDREQVNIRLGKAIYEESTNILRGVLPEDSFDCTLEIKFDVHKSPFDLKAEENVNRKKQ